MTIVNHVPSIPETRDHYPSKAEKRAFRVPFHAMPAIVCPVPNARSVSSKAYPDDITSLVSSCFLHGMSSNPFIFLIKSHLREISIQSGVEYAVGLTDSSFVTSDL